MRCTRERTGTLHGWLPPAHTGMLSKGLPVQILQPAAETSGRRLQAWGNPKATFVHFLIGLRWYLGATPEQLKALYVRMYTDDYR